MRKPRRFLVPDESESRGHLPPVGIYHVVTRVVDRRFVLETKEKEQLRVLLRMYERFSGCQILSYCLMSNHLHVLLEVPSGCAKGESLGLFDEELLRRLGGLYSVNYTQSVKREISEARDLMTGNYEDMGSLSKAERERNVRLGTEALEAIHARYSYRMHSLSEFFKGMLQRFTCWFNREHGRKGTLWESRFRSVLVQDGLAARTMAAYIDLNPVRAGMVEDPADYRWSSYGEAVGGGRGAKKAQAGLVRAMFAFEGTDRGMNRQATVRRWAQGGASKEYRRILIAEGMAETEERGHAKAKQRVVTRKGMQREKAEAELARLSDEAARDLKISKVIRCRVRYFTEGAVIGSKGFVDTVFKEARERFGPKRKDGARKPRGALSDLAGDLWSLRDLQKT
jgi:REP element-mobilizing transposase RayT